MIARVTSPVHQQPVLDGSLFDRFWYLFLAALQDRLNKLLGQQIIEATQAELAAIAATLTAGDAGIRVSVTDFGHVLQWSGAGWQWGPGELGSGFIQGFAINPTGNGWQLCNGSTVTYLKSDGTTGSYSTPDLISTTNDAAYMKLGSPVGGPNAAAAPTWHTGAKTDSENAHTHSVTQGSISQGAGSSASVDVGAITSGGSAHFHTLSNANAPLNPDGEPRNMVLRPYFRR